MKLFFVKMHACGNDYIFFDCIKGYMSTTDTQKIFLNGKIIDPAMLTSEISRRHFSVGSDGAVFICPSSRADAEMRMFNADGSEGKMCGNAIRCVGKYLYESGYVNKNIIFIETLSGIKKIHLNIENKKIKAISVEMGKAEFEIDKIPLSIPAENKKYKTLMRFSEKNVSGIHANEFINEKIKVIGKEYQSTALTVGNPHLVTYENRIDNLNLEKIGPFFENYKFFPERINTEFVEIIDTCTLKMRVWERGSKETLACGTGACAAVAASAKIGMVDFSKPVKVILAGGELSVVCTPEFNLTLTGGAVKVYEGVYEYEDRNK